MPIIEPAEYELVRNTALFKALPEALFRDLIDAGAVRQARRGEILFIQGDPVKCCFVVLDGWVKLYRLSPTGDEAIVAIFTRGQPFAEGAVFSRRMFPVSAEAVTDCRILCIPADVLLGRIRSNPEIGLTMLASVSMHLEALVRQIEQLKSHTGAQRVAEFLVSLAPGNERACTIGLPYDKALIAGRLGMKPESLSRAFARLKSLGVAVEQSSVSIEDIHRLNKFIQDERPGVTG